MSGCEYRDSVASYLLGSLPEDEHELDILCGRLVEAAETWANACLADRPRADVSEL